MSYEPSKPRKYVEYAKVCRERGQYEAAANYYTAAAHGRFLNFRRSPDIVEGGARPESDIGSFGLGIRELLSAILCYRLGDNPKRARNRCQIGKLLIDDARKFETDFNDVARQGWCHEAMGDLAVFGNLNLEEGAYQTAKELYKDVDDPLGWLAEDEFEFLIQPLFSLADSVGYDLTKSTQTQIRRRSLVERVRFKEDHYSEIIARVINIGSWKSEMR